MKEIGASTMMGGAPAGTSAAVAHHKGTSLMQKGINVRCKSGKTSDGGGGANMSKLNSSINAGGCGTTYGTRK